MPMMQSTLLPTWKTSWSWSLKGSARRLADDRIVAQVASCHYDTVTQRALSGAYKNIAKLPFFRLNASVVVSSGRTSTTLGEGMTAGQTTLDTVYVFHSVSEDEIF